MSLFSDSLKKWFYHNDSNAAKAGTRICLLDASGDPAGSDELLRSLSFAQCPDDYVDMGLPSGTLWAKKNLGAVSETDYGMYVSWGNLEMHPYGDGYNFSQNNYDISPAASISTDLTLEQDVAHSILGCGWRMTTKADLDELVAGCNTSWTTDYEGSGIAGRVFTSKTNGNTLFFPASGCRDGNNMNNRGTAGYYWETGLNSTTHAKHMYIGSGGVDTNGNRQRNCGCSIRPVL